MRRTFRTTSHFVPLPLLSSILLRTPSSISQPLVPCTQCSGHSSCSLVLSLVPDRGSATRVEEKGGSEWVEANEMWPEGW